MNAQRNNEITLYLTQILNGYEVIPANFGWHIHKGNTYCGYLEYQGTKEWQGSALTYLPKELKQQIQNFAQPSYSIPWVATYDISPASEPAKVA